MRFRAIPALIGNAAPRIVGAVFCLVALLANSACDKQGDTPDWNTPGGRVPVAAAAPAEPPTAPEPTTNFPESTSSGELRFISYNVENWLTMERHVDGKPLERAPKPEAEKQAVVQILARHTPDVIGLCEVGDATDLAEVQKDLKAAGLDLPHSHFTGGSDPVRHLGFLSRFPITATAKPTETQYRLAGRTFAINRGILDVTVEAHRKPYRFLGVHLKSKRDSEQGDQEAIRLSEARLLRRHLDSILKTDANARLIVYGDFNDTRATPTVKTITGNYNDPSYLTAIPAKDCHHHAWTHHWALHDLYSRIDFIMVSQALRKDVDFPAAKIIDDAEWDTASDHRAILAIFN